jgi:DNA-binding CsgD family transcriptional regulator
MERDGLLSDDTAGTAARAARSLILFAAIAALMAIDLVADAASGAETGHLGVEALVMILAVGGAVALWRQLRAARVHAARLDRDLASARAEAGRYRQEAHEALQGLGAAIESQFERWGLTPAEREVGLLLLKGLSHREVAEVRSTSEPTVRQQALAVYRKSGLRNRSDLSAFFLEDLLLPRAESG